MKVNELIDLYIKGRDKLSALKQEYDEKKAPVEAKMDKIEKAMLVAMEQLGVDSFKTESGTVYKSILTSVSIVDKEIFINYTKDHEAWHLLEMRASKSGVEDFMAANDELPPGVSITRRINVNFKRSA